VGQVGTSYVEPMVGRAGSIPHYLSQVEHMLSHIRMNPC